MTMKKGRKVNFLANADDLEVLVLARLGQTTSSIATRIKLSQSQVQYRITQGGGTWCRREFRNGESKEFGWCYHAVSGKVASHEMQIIKQAIAKKIDKLS